MRPRQLERHVGISSKLGRPLLLMGAVNIGLVTGALYLWGYFRGEWILLSVLLLLLCLPFAVPLKKSRDVFEVIYLFVFVYFLAFWLRALLAVLDFREFTLPWALQMGASEVDIVPTLVLAIVGLCAVYLGYYVPIGKYLCKLMPKIGERWNSGRASTISVLCALALVSTWVYFFRRGYFSIQYMWDNRGEIGRGQGDLHALMEVSAFVIVVMILSRMSVRPRGANKKLVFLLLPLAVAAPLTIFGDMETTGTVLFPALIMWHYVVRPFRKKEQVALVLGIFACVVVYAAVRTEGGIETLTIGIGNLLRFELLGQFSYWDNLLVVLRHIPGYHGFYYGRIMSGDLLGLIPRRLWAGKPLFYGQQVVQMEVFPKMIDPYSGIGHYEAFSFLGWGYADFGVPGALFAAFCHGVVWRGVYEALRSGARARSPLNAAVYGLVLFMLPKVMRGFVGSFIAMFVVVVPVMVILRYVSGGKARTAGPSHPVARSVGIPVSPLARF